MEVIFYKLSKGLTFMNCLFSSSLNVPGLKNSVKCKDLFLFCKEQKAEILILQEIHSQKDD